MKVGHSRNPNSVVVVKAEWDKFIIEQKLFDLVEGINQTAVSNKWHFFINFGSKARLQHRPIDQFNGRVKMSNVGTYLSTRQRKLHKKISHILLNLRLSDKLYGSEVSKEDSMEDGIIAEEQDDTITNKEPEKKCSF